MPSQVKEKEVVQYQWIKGDNQGNVETFDKMDGKFFVFESGKRCNQEVIGEFMMKVDLDNPVLQFEDPIGSVKKSQPHTSKKLENNRNNLTNAINEIKQPPKSSPIIALLEKAKTKKTKLNTRIDMNLPSKELLMYFNNHGMKIFYLYYLSIFILILIILKNFLLRELK